MSRSLKTVYFYQAKCEVERKNSRKGIKNVKWLRLRRRWSKLIKDIIDKQCMWNDDSMLAVSDEYKKIA